MDHEGAAALVSAAAEGDAEAVERVVCGGGAWAGRAQEALAVAAGCGHVAAVRALIRAGVQCDRAEGGQRAEDPLLEAAWNGHVAVVGLLLERGGARADATDPETGGQALHFAAHAGGDAMCETLLAHGAPVDATERLGRTPLLIAATAAARCGDGATDALAVCRRLLAAGADAGAADLNGQTVLHLAAWAGDEALVGALLAAGADPRATDAQGATALHRAAQRGRAGLCRALVAAGAPPNARDGAGLVPLALAAAAQKLPALVALLELGADASLCAGRERLPPGVVVRTLAAWAQGRSAPQARRDALRAVCGRGLPRVLVDLCSEYLLPTR